MNKIPTKQEFKKQIEDSKSEEEKKKHLEKVNKKREEIINLLKKEIEESSFGEIYVEYPVYDVLREELVEQGYTIFDSFGNLIIRI